MKTFNILFLLILLATSSNAFANNMSNAFDKRDRWQRGANLGNPYDARKFLRPNDDVSHLKGLRDASLMDGGQNELRTNPAGRFLQKGEVKKIEAKERYRINARNPILKDSLRIEDNPMAKTGGRNLQKVEQQIPTIIRKSCIEGVEFDVDVGLELVLEAEEVDYLSEWQCRETLLDGRWVYAARRGWVYGEKMKKKKFTCFIRHAGHGNPNPQIREHIAAEARLDVEQIREDLQVHIRGEGYEHRVGSKVYIRDKFRVGYHAQDRLKKLVEKGEYWQVSTEGTQQLAEANECYETARICLKIGVKTFLGKYEVTRPCWYEKISYHCKSPPKGGCAHLEQQNCRLQESECEFRVGPICLKYKRHFLCGGQKKRLNYSLAGSKIYCLGGDCHTPTLEENQDFANVAHLAAINEAQKDCVKGGNGMCLDPITVFPGEVEGCQKTVTGMINCCSSMKGWGRNIGVSRCSGAERGLALKRDRELCHNVGSYCSQKDPVFGKCLKRQRKFCCFSSKLSRFFHEEGRSQLGISWGSARRPNCRAFTLDELKSLDFTKFDMDKLFKILLIKGKGNAAKQIPMPNIDVNTPPEQQQEHMKTTPQEKREIRRRAEAAAKAEAERLERERLAKIEAERLERERLERERLARIAAERREQERAVEKLALEKQIAAVEKEIKYQQGRAQGQFEHFQRNQYIRAHANRSWNAYQDTCAKQKKLYKKRAVLKQKYNRLR